MTWYVVDLLSGGRFAVDCYKFCLGVYTTQVDPDQAAAAANVFDDSDDEQPESTALPQPTSQPKVSKLAELANKKRKEMVQIFHCSWRLLSRSQKFHTTSSVFFAAIFKRMLCRQQQQRKQLQHLETQRKLSASAKQCMMNLQGSHQFLLHLMPQQMCLETRTVMKSRPRCQELLKMMLS